MHDFSQKFLFQTRSIRGQFVRLTQTYQQTLAQHQYPENLKRLLGEALVSTALIHGLFKQSGKMTLQFQGEGALKLLSVHGDLSYMRGLIQYEPEVEGQDLLAALQSGKMMVSYDFGGKSQHQSILEVVSSEMTKNIEHYFSISEQIPTRIWMHSSPFSVSALLLQVLPSDDPDEQLHWEDAVIRTETLFDQELQTTAPEMLLPKLFPEDEIQLMPAQPIDFHCPCSKDRMENAVRLLGKEEALKILDKELYVQVECQFCRKKHDFDSIDITHLFLD